MAFQESDGVLLVPQHRIQAGPGREIAVHVWVIREQAVRDPSRRDWSLGVHHLLHVVCIDVPPPSLGVADEVHVRKRLQHSVESLDAHVVGSVLEVDQYRHSVVTRDRIDQLHRRRIALHWKLLLADAQRAPGKVFLEDPPSLGEVRQFVREIYEPIGMP